MNAQSHSPAALAAAIADDLTPQLYAASRAAVGVAIRVSNQRLALGRLPYLVATLDDPELFGLLFRASPEAEGEIWIIRPEAVGGNDAPSA
jgi:hypothetical protein